MTAVRLAVPADAPELVRLRGVMLRAMGSTGTGWEAAAEARFRSGLAQGDVVAAVVEDPEGGLCASAVAVVVAAIPSSLAPTGRHALIGSVCTDEVHRGRGLGRAVVEALLAELDAREVDVADLHATPDGEALYRSLGFAPQTWPDLRRRRPAPGR